jgi:hypothetical protein
MARIGGKSTKQPGTKLTHTRNENNILKGHRFSVLTETKKFIQWDKKLKGRIVSTTPRSGSKERMGVQKSIARGTYGGDLSDYLGPEAARTA